MRPTRHAHSGARIVFPLLGLAAACIASYSYAQVGKSGSDTVEPGIHAVQVSRTHGAPARETIALVRKGDNNVSIWGPNDDMQAIEAAKRGVGGEFLLIHRAGKDYVVTDPALLARAHDAWRETDALSQQMEALGGQMEVHGNKMEALGERMENLSARQEPAPELHAAVRDLERQQQVIAREELRLAEQRNAAEGDTAQQQRIQRQMEALWAKQEALMRRYEQQLEAEAQRFEAQQQPMEALVRQMDLANEPMEALSRRMEVLGRQHEKAANETERELRKLIHEALDRKLARPAPARASAQ